MSRIKRMSPALVISILALIVALVVPAVAQVATKALTKREVVVVRKVSAFQANRAVTRRAPRIARFQANRQITRRTTCPAGTIAVNDLCWDAVSRTSSGWFDAFGDCVERNASLPTPGQLGTAADELGIGSTLTDYHWTDGAYFDAVDGGDSMRAVSVNGDTPPELAFSEVDVPAPYRCVRRTTEEGSGPSRAGPGPAPYDPRAPCCTSRPRQLGWPRQANRRGADSG
jgi:hypothetical protein